MQAVKFIKNHVQYKQGKEYDLEDAHANYLIRVGVAEPPEKKQINKPSGKKAVKKPGGLS